MKLTLDSLHTWRTYAGVMEGVPSSKQMIESAKKRVETSYCIGRPIYVIEPWVTVHPFQNIRVPSIETIPEWAHAAMFMGPPVQDKAADGAELCVLWFDKEPLPIAVMGDFLTEDIWNKYAKDWWW